jgi:hypothetical protein
MKTPPRKEIGLRGIASHCYTEKNSTKESKLQPPRTTTNYTGTRSWHVKRVVVAVILINIAP